MSVITSKRKSIKHLHQINDIKLIEMIQSTGYICPDSIMLKIDGFPIKVGKDTIGNIFIESSQSGPVYEIGTFTDFTLNKGYSPDSIEMKRAFAYDDILLSFRTRLLEDLIDLIPNDTKVFMEVLYNDLSELKDNKRKFVHTWYDNDKLGYKMTLFPHKIVCASTGKDTNDYILWQRILNFNNDTVKIINPYLQFDYLEVPLLPKYSEEQLRILSSRKHTDKLVKEQLKQELYKYKLELEHILWNTKSIKDKYKIGNSLEGLIFTFNDEQYKITSTEFKRAILGSNV